MSQWPSIILIFYSYHFQDKQVEIFYIYIPPHQFLDVNPSLGNGPLVPGNIPNFPSVRPAVDDHDKLANSKLLLKNKIKENARQVIRNLDDLNVI